MPRIEIHLSGEVLEIIQTKAQAAGQSRKKYLETLAINDAMAEPHPIISPYDLNPEPGQYVKHGTGYVFEYEGEILYVSFPLFYHDNFQFHFTGEAGSVDDAILL